MTLKEPRRMKIWPCGCKNKGADQHRLIYAFIVRLHERLVAHLAADCS